MGRFIDLFRRRPRPAHVTVWIEQGGRIRSFYAFMRRQDDYILLEPLGDSRFIPGVEAVAKLEKRPEPEPQYEWKQEGTHRYLQLVPSPVERRVANA